MNGEINMDDLLGTWISFGGRVFRVESDEVELHWGYADGAREIIGISVKFFAMNAEKPQTPKPTPEKPPLSLRPRFVKDSERQKEIQEAMNRYISANMPIPPEWWEELNEILAREKARLLRGGFEKEPLIC